MLVVFICFLVNMAIAFWFSFFSLHLSLWSDACDFMHEFTTSSGPEFPLFCASRMVPSFVKSFPIMIFFLTFELM